MDLEKQRSGCLPKGGPGTRASCDCATIHNLPTELLCRIIHAAVEFRFSSSTLTDAARILLSLSHVSRYWRAVTLSIPEIWGRLINVAEFSEHQVTQFIDRSKSSPIELYVDGGPPSPQNAGHIRNTQARFSRVLRELDRVTYLVIRLFHLSPDNIDCLCKPAPSLDVFSVQRSGRVPAPLAPRLFDNNAPRLRSLSLTTAIMDLNQASFPGLRELIVSDIYEPFSSITSIDSWLHFLSNHPFLTSLTISHAISYHTLGLYKGLPKVNLAQLRELTLSEGVTQCARLLPKIIVPNSCRVSIIAFLDDTAGIPLLQAAFTDLLSTRSTRDLQVTLTGVSISFTNSIDGFTSLPQPESPCYFKFQWQQSFESFEDMGLYNDNIFDFHGPGLLTVQHLRIILQPVNGRYPLEDEVLQGTFGVWLGGFGWMTDLIIDSSTLSELLDFLGSARVPFAMDEEEENRQVFLYFPCMSGLEVVKTEEEENYWEALITFARRRYDIKQNQYSIKCITVPEAETEYMDGDHEELLASFGVRRLILK